MWKLQSKQAGEILREELVDTKTDPPVLSIVASTLSARSVTLKLSDVCIKLADFVFSLLPLFVSHLTLRV